MEVGLGPGDFVFDRDPYLTKRGTPTGHNHPHPIFGPCLLWPNGWIDQDATWYRGEPRPRRRSVRWGRSSPLKGHSPQFSVHVYYSQTTGWLKAPLGTEVDLGPGHIVLDGVPALLEGGTAAPLFTAHVYCGHGRLSQLLLSSCTTLVIVASCRMEPTFLWPPYVIG